MLSKFFLSVCQNIILFYLSTKNKVAIFKNIVSVKKEVYKKYVFIYDFLQLNFNPLCDCSISLL